MRHRVRSCLLHGGRRPGRPATSHLVHRCRACVGGPFHRHRHVCACRARRQFRVDVAGIAVDECDADHQQHSNNAPADAHVDSAGPTLPGPPTNLPVPPAVTVTVPGPTVVAQPPPSGGGAGGMATTIAAFTALVGAVTGLVAAATGLVKVLRTRESAAAAPPARS